MFYLMLSIRSYSYTHRATKKPDGAPDFPNTDRGWDGARGYHMSVDEPHIIRAINITCLIYS